MTPEQRAALVAAHEASLRGVADVDAANNAYVVAWREAEDIRGEGRMALIVDGSISIDIEIRYTEASRRMKAAKLECERAEVQAKHAFVAWQTALAALGGSRG
jgi:hypothetical protein